MRLTAAIRQDVRFQFRHGFYYAYAILTVIYIILMRMLPEGIVYPALTLILFTDICALGFFFVGAIVLLEKGQNLTNSLFVTPLRLHEYLLSKIVSFLVLSTASASLIIIGGGVWGQDMLWFASGLILSSAIYTCLGLIFAANARHVNDFFVRSMAVGGIISLPLFAYLGLFDSNIFYLFPTRATLILLDVMGSSYALGEKLYSILSLFVWGILLGGFSYRQFDQHVRHPA